MSSDRQWTIYLAQDKHLDYNWCGTNTEIEIRMARVLDGYLALAERSGVRWNLDSTLWAEVYRRHRGEAGFDRLMGAIREGRIGYAAPYSVLLWGLLSTELAVRACAGSREIEQTTGIPGRTALIMENAGLLWGAANILTASGFANLGRGIYPLRAESYNPKREPYPLFWWEAPGGKRVLVHWDLFDDTRAWGGYAEAAQLGFEGGLGHDPLRMQTLAASDAPDVYEKRREFIRKTVERHEAYGDAYPISSILLLGTGHDQWVATDAYSAFMARYNADPENCIRLVDARYDDFFEAARAEIREKGLDVPTLKGSFGICWEEWGAHLGGLTAAFREADRLLRIAEAAHALAWIDGRDEEGAEDLLRQATHALLSFAEHDMGGCNRRLAAISAGARAAAATEAQDIARSLCPDFGPRALPSLASPEPEETTFTWRKTRVVFDEERCAVASLVDEKDREWVPQGHGPAFGEFVHTRYPNRHQREAVFPEALEASPQGQTHRISCRRGRGGVEVRTEGERWGFGFETRWRFHSTHPWIDVVYRLTDGWTEDAQTVQFCFPLALEAPTCRYDTAGTVLTAGPADADGDDLPGSNPDLFAAQTFASASDGDRYAILLTPDAFLVEFGPGAVRAPGYRTENVPAMIASMPLMSMTRNDRQFGQGGQREWMFRYRLVLAPGRYDPLRAVREAQLFCTPPHLQAPGMFPVLRDMAPLELKFNGGPITAFKVAEDGERLILRLCNLRDRAAEGSVRLPSGFSHAERCDALERPLERLTVAQGHAAFSADARDLVTLAFCR